MKIVVKQRHGTKWLPIDMTQLVGTSILNFMLASKEDLIAALHQDDEAPVAFVSNSDKYVDMYRSKGLSLHVQVLKDLMGTEVAPPLLIQLFPGSFLAGVTAEKAA